jgi:hypothetical protein
MSPLSQVSSLQGCVVAIGLSLVAQQDTEPPAALGGCFQYWYLLLCLQTVCQYEPSITAGQ